MIKVAKNGASVGEEIRYFHFQRFGQRSNHQQGRVALAPLNAANVRPMVARTGGELFLAPATLLAQRSQMLTEFRLQGLHTDIKPRYSPREQRL